MARYIDADKLIEFVKEHTPTINGETTMECVQRAIRNAPTADVVPKSEVEALKHQLEMIIDEGEYWEGKFSVAQSAIENIFEEMKKSVASKLPMQVRPAGNYDDFTDGFRDGKTDALIEVLVLIAKLKKKYTESEDKG